MVKDDSKSTGTVPLDRTHVHEVRKLLRAVGMGEVVEVSGFRGWQWWVHRHRLNRDPVAGITRAQPGWLHRWSTK